MANPISNWLYTGATPGTQAATQTLAQTTPWGKVGKQILAEGAFGIKGKPGGFGSVNVGFDPKYTGRGATNIGGYVRGGVQSVLGMGAKGNIAGGTGAGRLAFEKLLQSPLAKSVGTVGRYASPLGWGAAASQGLGWLANEYAKATNTPEAYDYLTSITKTDPFAFDETNLDVGDYFTKINKLNKNKFMKQQLMNKKKQQIQQKIRQHEVIEAAKKKITTDGPPSILSRPKPKPYVSPARPHGNGGGGGDGGGFGKGKDPGGGAAGSPFNSGGLVNFYRYGGFI